jgi:hypothetical protein
MTSNFDKFTERSRKVLSLSQQEAQRFDHAYIGTEHLLLALINERDGIAARVLAKLGVQLPKARAAVEFTVGRGAGPVTGDIGLTPRAKQVIELAVDEARRLDASYIGTEHLLLGLIRVTEGVAVRILDALGVGAPQVRQQVMLVIEQSKQAPRAKDAPKEAAAPPKPSEAQRIETELEEAKTASDPNRVWELEVQLAKAQLRELDDRKNQLVTRLVAGEQKTDRDRRFDTEVTGRNRPGGSGTARRPQESRSANGERGTAQTATTTTTGERVRRYPAGVRLTTPR